MVSVDVYKREGFYTVLCLVAVLGWGCKLVIPWGVAIPEGEEKVCRMAEFPQGAHRHDKTIP